MRLKRDVVEELLREKGITKEEFAHLYKGTVKEFDQNCETKCGFQRAYRVAEILDVSVDDIVTYGNERWPLSRKRKGKRNK